MEIQNPSALQASTSTSPSGSQSLGRDAFLRLLVAQLQNQDPLDPMDAREMVSQLAELTSVEKLERIDAGLTGLQIASAGMANVQAAGLVGRQVVADASGLRLDEAGSARGAFTLEGPAATVTATIRDAQGRAVRTVELPGGLAGDRSFDWDGLDGSGQRLPPGRYQVEYTARSADGTPVGVSSEVRGMVTAISYEGGYPELRIGEARVLLGDVRSIEM